MDFKEIIEPLRDLFKDEVRNVGRAIGIPEFLVARQPFPGPGLAIRVIGAISKDKLDILREADFIFREEVKKAGISAGLGQYFAVLTNLRSVGVMGDERTYSYTVALRSVDTSDFMTADWSRIPYDILARVSNRIVNEVDHVNRIVYDITVNHQQQSSGNNRESKELHENCKKATVSLLISSLFCCFHIGRSRVVDVSVVNIHGQVGREERLDFTRFERCWKCF